MYTNADRWRSYARFNAKRSLDDRQDTSTADSNVSHSDQHTDDESEPEQVFSLPRNVQPMGYIDTSKMDMASMDTPLDDRNPGYRMMKSMGWTVGEGLGAQRTGIKDPLALPKEQSMLGIGKQAEMEETHAQSTSQRKLMQSEKLLVETDEARMAREALLEQQRERQENVQEARKAFFCELCQKGYKKVGEYETHLSSYDHNHKKRFKEMRDTARKAGGGKAGSDRDKQREKERKREEKELKKMLGNACVKAHGTPVSSVKSSATEDGDGNTVERERPNEATLDPTKSNLPEKEDGAWVQEGKESAPNETLVPAKPSGGWSTDPAPPMHAPQTHHQRSGGWSTESAPLPTPLLPPKSTLSFGMQKTHNGPKGPSNTSIKFGFKKR
ncbi:hypothetical protein BZG36_01352 [Bifiguratus adelaidae]|uniref:G-patch domain-containing protein n=1 Tax=Bifiguratus adelaidae TaxID=1938954 RepID=A0A261Y3A0_9FUNG|nr:hypothetical protein BZG36_01352 [Bifiguratus adelaidae]